MKLLAHSHRPLRFGFARLALTWVCVAAFTLPALAQTNQALPFPSRLVMSQGIVEIRKVGTEFWTPVRPRQIFQPGDRLRTGERSRAEVYLTGGMTVQKGEFSEMEIPPSSEPTFKRGLFKIFNREPARGSQFGLPNTTTAAIRGTDFIVKVDENGDAEVTVLDGEVVLSNLKGEVALGRMERGKAERDRAPGKSAVIEAASDLIQWNLYYPAVLDPSELGWTAAEKAALTLSLEAYSSGDLVRAVDLYSWKRADISPAESAYQAALLLSVGQVDKAQLLLRKLGDNAPRSLTRLIAAVKSTLQPEWPKPRSTSDWLAESYYQQSRHQLELARVAARAAVTNAPAFGFAWARLAEMEFSFGRRKETAEAIAHALTLSQRNAQALALQGFILAAQGQTQAALAQFDRAIEADAALGNAWLGRGLCSFRAGRATEGLQDLLVAASLEPQRGLLRSYLGKAFAQTGDTAHAAQELRLAMDLDPQDPTPWLYSALLHQERHEINKAIRTLIPESTAGVGSLSAPEFETAGLAVDLKLGSKTYAGLQAERLASDVSRQTGVFTAQNGTIPVTPDSITEQLNFEEHSLALHLSRLLGDEFVAGARYRLTRSDLKDNYPGVPGAILTTANPTQISNKIPPVSIALCTPNLCVD